MRRIAIHLAYQGTHFNGYHIQPRGRTVQKELEKALERLLGHPCHTSCAGRTDTGVHALAQVVHFETSHHLPLDKFVPALNRFLPPDLVALQAFAVSAHFHARFGAQARHYRYILYPHLGPHPFLTPFVWLCPYLVSPESIPALWQSLMGSHNFKAFCKTGSHRKNYQIQVWEAKFQVLRGYYCFDIKADSFLYNMVRGLVGTVLDIARGRLPANQLEQLLKTQNRSLLGKTAPPQGLYLYDVVYPENTGVVLQQSPAQLLPPLAWDLP